MQTTALQSQRQSVASIILSTDSLPPTARQAPKLSEKFLLLENRSQEYVHVKRFVLHTASSISQNLCRCTEKSKKIAV